MARDKNLITHKTGVLLLVLVLLLCGCSSQIPQTAITSEQTATMSQTPAQSSGISGDISSEKPNTSTKKKNSSTPTTTAYGKINFCLTSSKLSYILPKNYYYAARFNGNELAAYKILEKAISTHTVGKINMGKITEQQLRLIYTAVRDDYPQYFWMSNQYFYSTNSKNEIILVLKKSSDSSGYPVSVEERNEMATKFKTVIAKIKTDLEKIAQDQNHTVYDFEEYILNWLCKNVEYCDTKENDLIYTAYGALVNGKAVCEGYARAASLMFNLAGIENGLVNGKDAKGTGHLWNIVKINGTWYHFDATWADDENRPDSPYPFYFNLSDEEITRDRTINANLKANYENIKENFNFDLPTCDKSGKKYSAQNILVLTDKENLSKQLLTALGNYLLQNREKPKDFFDVIIDRDISVTDAVNLYKQISFKQVITAVNKTYLSTNQNKIAEYTVSATENGDFRIYLTFKSGNENGKK